MKCPQCGLDNPASATVCQCGYSLGTGKASLRESLAEQAQGFRKEVEKIQTVDPDVPRGEISTIKVDSDVHAEVGKGHKSKGVGQRLLIALAILFVPMVVVFNVLSSLTEMSDDALRVVIIWPGGFLVTILVFAVFCGKREPGRRRSKSKLRRSFHSVCSWRKSDRRKRLKRGAAYTLFNHKMPHY